MNIIDAVSENNYTAVKKCLFLGENPNATDDYAGVTPLHIAVQLNSINTVRLLLNWNACINRKEVLFNQTPLDVVNIIGNKKIIELISKYSHHII